MTEKKTKKTGWPRSRLAHSNEGRVGQAWKPGKVLKEGVDIFGNKKKFLVENRVHQQNIYTRKSIVGYYARLQHTWKES